MKQRHRTHLAEINVVPYVDVMLVLLVIFMVSAPLLTQGFEVDLARVQSKPVALPDPVVVSVLADKTYRINIGQSPQQAASAQTIATRLKTVLAHNPELAVLIEGDARVPYGEVLTLLGILQSSGIHNVGLVTQPPIDP